MPWLTCHNPEIDWKTGEVKITRCLKKCGKQWKPKQEKSGWQKQKEKEEREEKEQKKEKEKRKKPRRGKTIEVKGLAEEWEIWNEEDKAAKSEAETRKLVPECFYKQIQVFGRKASKQMPMKKLWDHVIDIKEGKGVFTIKGGKRRGVQVYLRAIEERVYQALKVASNGTSIFYRKEGWKEAYGTGLQISK